MEFDDHATFRRQLSRLMIVVCAVLWSCSGLFAKSPIMEDWPTDHRATLLAFWRALFAGTFLLPFARKRFWSWKLVPAIAVFASMNVTFLSAMSWTTAANAIWLQSTAPIWVFLFSVVVLRQPVPRLDWLMLCLGGLGVALILTCELNSTLVSQTSQRGVVCGLISGVAFAGVIICLKSLPDVDSIWVVTVLQLSTAAVLLPFAGRYGSWPSQGQLAWLAVFGIVQMGVPYVLFTRAVRTVSGHEAAFLVLLEPILVPFWVWVAWRHHATYQPTAPWTFWGAGLILIGLAIRFGAAMWTSSRRRR
jgi:drug/metabolite transporter (DMT)-like permease